MFPNTIFLYFITYSFLGWCCETTYVSLAKRSFVNRGFLYGPLCPIYGFGALLVLYSLEPFAKHLIIIFGLAMIVTSSLEYFTSWLMEAIFHIRWWDYTTYKYNIKGRICLKNTLLFGILGIVAVYGLHPIVELLIQRISIRAEVALKGILLTSLIGDSILSILSAINVNKALNEVNKLIIEFQQNGEITKQRITKKVHTLITKLEKRYYHFKKAYPNLKHKHYHFERLKVDEVIKKMKTLMK